MTKTINRLPAILLAAIIAAALVMAIGLSPQSAFAKEKQAVGSMYYVLIAPDNYQYKALPNSTSHVEVTILDSAFDDVTKYAYVQETSWSVEGDANIEGNGLEATVSFGDMPLDVDEEDITVKAAVTIDGQLYTGETGLTKDRDFDTLVTTGIDPYLQVGETASVTAQVMNYSEENRDGKAYAATVEWEYEKADVEVTGDPSGPEFKVKRLSEADTYLFVTAKWEKDGQTMEDSDIFFLNEISNDLANYDIIVTNAATGNVYLDNIKGTFTPEVRVTYGDYVLPADKYDVVIQKYEGYDSETGESYLEPYNSKALVLDPKDAVNKAGEAVGGTGFYCVSAKAKDGSGYTGTTYNDWVMMYDKHTLNYYNAIVDFGEDNLMILSEYPYIRYDFTPEKAAAFQGPKVTIADQEAPSSAYKLTYLNTDTMQTSNAMPAEKGEYLVKIEGVDPYYGEDVDTWIKIGDPNPMTIKGKNVNVKKGKKTTIKTNKAFNIKNQCGDVSYFLSTVNDKYEGKDYDKFQVAENGKITVKKGLKKGTYKLKIWASSPGDATHLAYDDSSITVKIKVK